jgi:twitching motility protein PilT
MSYTIAADASDLHLSAGNPTMIRVHGALREILGTIPNNARVEELIKQIISEENFKTLKKTRELDISYAHSSGNRFRVNVYMAQGEWASALRLIPQKIRTISELNLPDIIYDFTKIPQGLIIVAGPTGSGKSTTLASMLQEINLNRAEHILTIEDPIEYVYPKAKSRVDQRELGKDTLSWKNALRAALRQDPNVVLVGEMRDHETIESTVTVAETGHLVFATLHTNSAAQTVDRIIDVFPEGQQPQIRAQLSNVITAVISQRLIPVKSGGRRAIQEILVANTAVKNAIREGKTYQIDNVIQTSSEAGMQTMESALVKLVREGEITVQEAEENSVKVDELRALLKSNN